MRFRVDIHIHSNLDPVDGLSNRRRVMFSPRQVLDAAKKHGLDAIAFTHHSQTIYTSAMVEYASRLGITLIKGVEANLHDNPKTIAQGKHIIVLNPLQKTYTSIEQIREEKQSNSLMYVLAPHPFYPGGFSLGNLVEEQIDVFDGIEVSSVRPFGIDRWNKPAIALAKKYQKPLIATSDLHDLSLFGQNYTVVQVHEQCKSHEHKMSAIIHALKDPNEVSPITSPMNLSQTAEYLSQISLQTFRMYKDRSII